MAGRIFRKLKNLAKRTPGVRRLVGPAKRARDFAKNAWQQNPYRRAKRALSSRLESLMLAAAYLVENQQRDAKAAADRHHQLCIAVQSLEAKLASLQTQCQQTARKVDELASRAELHVESDLPHLRAA